MNKSEFIAIITLGITICPTASKAVHISSRGIGQVLIYPYYTAQKFDPTTNTSLNTTYSIVNTTRDAKAVKVRFLEGDNSIPVLDFNVYMTAYDVWTGVIGAKDNVWRPGNIGGAHGHNENTCAPFMDSVVDFRPFLVETLDDTTAADALQRSLEGHFIVMDMGTLNEADSALVDHGPSGFPRGCAEIEDRWIGPNGTWVQNDSILEPVSGGLYGGATILDVSEGYAVSYNAISLEDFWGESLLAHHTNPGSLAPNLTDAFPVSRVFKDQAFDSEGNYDRGGYVLETKWPLGRGIDAVSALFMTPTVMNEYVYDAGRDAKSEWVITFPTKHEYVTAEPTAPFSSVWNGTSACDDYEYSLWDREAQNEIPLCPITTPPSTCPQVICYSANVVEFLRDPFTPIESNRTSEILGSDNFVIIPGFSHVQHATASGWATIRFEETAMALTGGEGPSFKGLPLVGFMLQRYTNASAQPGLLAQYATAFNHVTEISSF